MSTEVKAPNLYDTIFLGMMTFREDTDRYTSRSEHTRAIARRIVEIRPALTLKGVYNLVQDALDRGETNHFSVEQMTQDVHQACCEVLVQIDAQPKSDAVNHPQHYNKHPSGVECIDIVRHFNFNVGNSIKYLWRAGLRGSRKRDRLTDLRKAAWYIQDEIKRLEDGTES